MPERKVQWMGGNARLQRAASVSDRPQPSVDIWIQKGPGTPWTKSNPELERSRFCGMALG